LETGVNLIGNRHNPAHFPARETKICKTSAGPTLVRSCCGDGRAMTRHYRGIDIHCSPFSFFAVIERKPMRLGGSMLPNTPANALSSV
jgi:hypothetical protein